MENGEKKIYIKFEMNRRDEFYHEKYLKAKLEKKAEMEMKQWDLSSND